MAIAMNTMQTNMYVVKALNPCASVCLWRENKVPIRSCTNRIKYWFIHILTWEELKIVAKTKINATRTAALLESFGSMRKLTNEIITSMAHMRL